MLEPTAGWILDSKSWSVVTVVVATTTPPPPSDSHHHHHWLQPVTAVLALLEDGRTGAYLLFSSPQGGEIREGFRSAASFVVLSQKSNNGGAGTWWWRLLELADEGDRHGQFSSQIFFVSTECTIAHCVPLNLFFLNSTFLRSNTRRSNRMVVSFSLYGTACTNLIIPGELTSLPHLSNRQLLSFKVPSRRVTALARRPPSSNRKTVG